MPKILITGGLGYVGTELCDVLSRYPQNEITVIDNRFIPNLVLKLVSKGIRFHQRDLFNIKDLLASTDICYHLAGITDVPQVASQSTPEKDAEITRIGTEGTRYIIENIYPFAKIIFASTQVVYDGLTEEKLNIDETFQPCPAVAYSKSKYQSELDLLNSPIQCIIARFASVYGYNENIRWKILPNLFSKMAAQNQDLKVFGAENYKPLIGINDLAELLLFFGQRSYNKEIFHCVDKNVRIIDIANLCQQYNPNIKIKITEDETPNKGFTLSNKKVKESGFVFTQTLEFEIAKMIKSWKNK
jgi:nucleoside-diphosphate-sugar epimerase